MDEWWRVAVIHEIYPRSFRDGVVDLPGIARRLDHVGAFFGTVASRQGHQGGSDG
jgi:hypothetical protein